MHLVNYFLFTYITWFLYVILIILFSQFYLFFTFLFDSLIIYWYIYIVLFFFLHKNFFFLNMPLSYVWNTNLSILYYKLFYIKILLANFFTLNFLLNFFFMYLIILIKIVISRLRQFTFTTFIFNFWRPVFKKTGYYSLYRSCRAYYKY